MSAIFLFGPGVRYVPEAVWHSKFFWIALAVMLAAILIFHNSSFKKMQHGSFLGKILSVFDSKTNPNAPQIRYASDGRSGHVWYTSKETKFAMYYEFGGGDCVAVISIPSPEEWESETKLPLARREEVLNFIGQQVVKDQTTGGRGRFKIEGDWLNIYV